MLKCCKYSRLLTNIVLSATVLFNADRVFALDWEFYPNHTLKLHGFLSQSYIKTDDNNVFGNSQGKGSIDYREIGLNASYSPHQSINLATQLLSRTAGKTDDGSIKIDFALADYRAFESMNFNAGIRLGRVKNPFGFFNDTRDVPFTRESIILPQSIYFERTRDISISSDGIELYLQQNLSPGALIFQFVAAQPRVKDLNTELALFQTDLPGSLSGDVSYVSRVIFDMFSGLLKLAYSNVMLNMHYDPVPGELFAGVLPLLEPMSINFNSNIFSIILTLDKFSITGEYARRNTKINDLNSDTIGYSYYIQANYRINYQWNLFARYDILFQDRNDKRGLDYAASPTALAPAHSRYAYDTTIGAQLNLSSQWMFRIEAHRIDGTAWLSLRDNPDLFNTTRSWTLFSILMAYRF